MKKILAVALLGLATTVWADEVTWTCVNFAQSSVSGSATEFQFANCINVLVTNNTNGKSVMLTAVDSGNTGTSTDFTAGPPLVADYNGSGPRSILVTSNGHDFLTGEMADSGRLEAQWPDRAGAFLSRFHVTFVDSAVLAELGTGPRWEPEGSVSLTLAETAFNGTTLTGTLGGGEYTITTTGITPEVATLFLYGTGLTAIMLAGRRYWR